MKTPKSLLCLSLGLVFAACQTTLEPEEDVRQVPDLLRNGNYTRALKLAERAHRKDPDNQVAAEDYRLASAAVLLERGRRSLFENRNQEALDAFQEAKAIAPEQPVIDDWIFNVSQKLALYWQRQGMSSQANGDLNQAVVHFNKSLEFMPDFQRSRSALMRTLLQLNYREGMGEQYYEEAVRDLHEHLLNEADFGFSSVLKYSPDNELAEERLERTREHLAEERAAIGRQLEYEGAWAAARNEFRVALLLDEGCEEARLGHARAAREAEAAEFLREADNRILRKEYDLARAALDEGRALTEFQEASFDGMEASIAESVYGDKYKRARTLESDQQFEAAVAAYDDLLADAEYFQDAITRRDTLAEYLDSAGALYEQALAEGTPEGQLRFLNRIAVFWPEYLDVAERIERLEAVVSPADAGADNGSSQPVR